MCCFDFVLMRLDHQIKWFFPAGGLLAVNFCSPYCHRLVHVGLLHVLVYASEIMQKYASSYFWIVHRQHWFILAHINNITNIQLLQMVKAISLRILWPLQYRFQLPLIADEDFQHSTTHFTYANKFFYNLTHFKFCAYKLRSVDSIDFLLSF